MRHRLTHRALLKFAKKNAGGFFPTVARGHPFMVDVVDDKIVCYPESGIDVWLSPSVQLKRFNETNSLRTCDYPSETFSNSYFVGLVAAMIRRTKRIPQSRRPSRQSRPLLLSPRFDREVRRLRQRAALTPPEGNASPPKKEIATLQVCRDPAVKAWVLKSSKGECASCRNPAPFNDDYNLPFLEVHHVIPLGENGPDTISNAVALCPDCHRAFHYAKDRRDRVDQLYRRYARLKK